jgi:enoyl-CoA hydratase
VSEVRIRKERSVGRITLARPSALNALSSAMLHAVDAALIAWAEDPSLTLVLIDAEGDRAFCAGGDIAEIYAAGRAGDFGLGREFWRVEYRMNDRIARFPKPVVVLIQGFCMGGGAGVACHASHRVVGRTTRIAMPECAIGLVPDVGGSFLLARAPGRLGAWLATTGTRMDAADAIYADFADVFVPEDDWPALTDAIIAAGDPSPVFAFGRAPAQARMPALQPRIDALFDAPDMGVVLDRLADADDDFSADTRKAIGRVSPLAVACAFEMQQRLRPSPMLRTALDLEFRFVWRAQEHSDFLEGIRAQVIEKDRRPAWRHAALSAVTPAEVAAMLAPLGPDTMTFPE